MKEDKAQFNQRIAVKSNDPQNPEVSLKGIKVERVPKEAGKVFERVARLDAVPASTVSGHVSFETSVAAQPLIEVPVIVHASVAVYPTASSVYGVNTP